MRSAGFLDLFGRAYRVDGTLVRGFDYYTRTTFEYECARLGAQKGIGGGGRYDNLVEEVGGQPTAAAGFGTGTGAHRAGAGIRRRQGPARGVDVFFIILADEARAARGHRHCTGCAAWESPPTPITPAAAPRAR